MLTDVFRAIVNKLFLWEIKKIVKTLIFSHKNFLKIIH